MTATLEFRSGFAIYGTIVATAVIAATGAQDETLGRIAVVTVLTLLVFWLAHVYSEVLAHGLRHGRFRFAVVRAIMTTSLR